MSTITFQKNIHRVELFILLVGILCLGSPLSLYGYFSEPIDITDSTLSAGTLEVGLSPSASTLAISPSHGDTMTFSTIQNGSLTAQYKITATPTACATGFWDGVEVTLTKSNTLYEGPLNALLVTSNTDGVWTLDAKALTSFVATDLDTCDFDIHLSAWQSEFADPTSGGFTDSSTFHITLTFNDDTPVVEPIDEFTSFAPLIFTTAIVESLSTQAPAENNTESIGIEKEDTSSLVDTAPESGGGDAEASSEEVTDLTPVIKENESIDSSYSESNDGVTD